MVPEPDMSKDVKPVRLYLSGFMGAGKSTVGQRLAERLDWSFVDLDDLIEREEGRTIPDIFRNDGEETFRELETQYLETMSRRPAPFILAVGGGAPIQSRNRDIMSETGVEVFLHVPFPVAFERIKQDEHRPLVPDGPGAEEELRSLWNERKDVYRRADWTIECDELEPDAVARRIETRLIDR